MKRTRKYARCVAPRRKPENKTRKLNKIIIYWIYYY